MLTPAGERADVAFCLLGRKADHVDHHIKSRVGKRSLEFRVVVSIARDMADFSRQAILPLSTIKHGDRGAALLEMFDNPRADQTRAADDENAHGGELRSKFI